MKQNIAENISSLYSQVTNQLFNEYKASSSISQKQNQYNMYYTKCVEELKKIETDNIEKECLLLENKIKERIEKIGQTKTNLITNSVKINSKDELISVENYIKNTNTLKEQFKDLNEKINCLDLKNPIDSIKKAKNEYENSNEHLLLQPLLTSLIEKRKFYDLVNKEKSSKLKILEEKKATNKENKLKIERLTKEYNTNSERMAKELEINEKLHKEIEKLNIELSNLGSDIKGNNMVEEQKNLEQKIQNSQEEIQKLNNFLEKSKKEKNLICAKICGMVCLLIMNKNKTIRRYEKFVGEEIKKISKENEEIITQFLDLENKCLLKMKEEKDEIKLRDELNKKINKYLKISTKISF